MFMPKLLIAYAAIAILVPALLVPASVFAHGNGSSHSPSTGIVSSGPVTVAQDHHAPGPTSPVLHPRKCTLAYRFEQVKPWPFRPLALSSHRSGT